MHECKIGEDQPNTRSYIQEHMVAIQMIMMTEVRRAMRSPDVAVGAVRLRHWVIGAASRDFEVHRRLVNNGSCHTTQRPGCSAYPQRVHQGTECST
jgi:hypothetical protein